MIRTVFLASSNPATGTGGASKVIYAYRDLFSRLNDTYNGANKYIVEPIFFHDCSFGSGLTRYIPAVAVLLLPFRLLISYYKRNNNHSSKSILWWHSFGIIDIIILLFVRVFIPDRISLVVVTLHNPIFFDHLDSIGSRLYLYLVALSRAKIHYLNSSYLADAGLSKTLRKPRIPSGYVSVNPLPNTLLNVLKERLYWTQSAVEKPSKHIFAMCQLIPGKQVDHLLRAFSLLPHDWILSIAGKGSEKNKLIDLCIQLNISKRVQFLGFIGDTEKRVAFSRSSVFCVPSVSDTQSIVNIEAIAYGLPLALYPYEPFVNIYSQYTSVFFSDSFSPFSLAEAIAKAEDCFQDNLERSKVQLLDNFGDDAIVRNFSPDIFSFSH